MAAVQCARLHAPPRRPSASLRGLRLFTSFAGILIAWYGIRWMLGGSNDRERMFGFAKLLLIIAFGYTMITLYESPIPGIGTSFSNLITGQAGYLASQISARSIQDAQLTLNALWNALEQPDPWSILANLLYWTLLIVIGLAQFAVMFVISFGRATQSGHRRRLAALPGARHQGQ